MKRVVLNVLAGTLVVALFSACGSGSGSGGKNMPTMKGTTYVNSNAKDEPMVFVTETVGVLEFGDDNKVEILFPYAIDTKNFSGSGFSISRELWISGEYEISGSTITIRFKLNESQEEPGVLEVQLKDDAKTLLGNQGESFNKMDK